MSTQEDTSRKIFAILLSRDRKIKQLEQQLVEKEREWAQQSTVLRSEMLKILRDTEKKELEAIQRERDFMRREHKLKQTIYEL